MKSNLRTCAILIVGTIVTITALGFILGLDKHVAMNEKVSLPEPNEPQIVVHKADRKLELFDGDKLIKTYKIALGNAPLGDKEEEGDMKTPEGEFYIFGKNPKSKYHLGLGISYPDITDAKRGSESGLVSKEEVEQIEAAIARREMPPQKTKLGGEIYIHGGGTASDWTEGCIALSDADVTELYELVGKGTPITILK